MGTSTKHYFSCCAKYVTHSINFENHIQFNCQFFFRHGYECTDAHDKKVLKTVIYTQGGRGTVETKLGL